MAPGDISLPHRHELFTEIYFLISGNGIMTVNGKELLVETGDTIVINPGEVHFLKNDDGSQLVHLVISNPPFDPGDVNLGDQNEA